MKKYFVSIIIVSTIILSSCGNNNITITGDHATVNANTENTNAQNIVDTNATINVDVTNDKSINNTTDNDVSNFFVENNENYQQLLNECNQLKEQINNLNNQIDELENNNNKEIEEITNSNTNSTVDTTDILHNEVNINDFWGIFNTNTINLYPSTTAANMIVNNREELTITTDLNDNVMANIKIVDYGTNEIVYIKEVLLGEMASFPNIPDGMYYFTIDCIGYKTYYSDLFQIEKSNSSQEVLDWSVGLEQDNNYILHSFKIQLKNDQGNILRNTTVYLQAVSTQKNNFNKVTVYTLYTNENGYLSLWENANSSDYIYFQLYNEFVLKVSLDNEKYFQVNPNEDTSICIIPL